MASTDIIAASPHRHIFQRHKATTSEPHKGASIQEAARGYRGTHGYVQYIQVVIQIAYRKRWPTETQLLPRHTGTRYKTDTQRIQTSIKGHRFRGHAPTYPRSHTGASGDARAHSRKYHLASKTHIGNDGKHRHNCCPTTPPHVTTPQRHDFRTA